MIQFTKGDMFAVSTDLRVNTVNCIGVMGAGVALAFKQRYPDMFEDYRQACRKGKVRPGSLHIWKDLTGDWIVNFPTKRDWRDPSRYEDIEAGLDELRSYLEAQGQVSVALPALGCGHGGLEWKRVSQMIEEKLGDLAASILVFEPSDSREAGLAAQEQSSSEHTRDLEALGFHVMELPSFVTGSNLPPTALAKGELALLSTRWIALLPSKAPSDREMDALNSIASEIARSQEQLTVALMYNTRASEDVAKLLAQHDVPVILILPFGPLTRQKIGRSPPGGQHERLVMVSVGAPKAAWSRPLLAQSMTLLRAGATCALISDPEPKWLSGRTARAWAERPAFYIRYELLPDDMRQLLDGLGARPIGRRADTREPNLAPLFNGRFFDKPGGRIADVDGQDHFQLPLAAESAPQIRELATIIEQARHPAGTIDIAVPRSADTEELRAGLRRIATGSKNAPTSNPDSTSQ